MRVAETTIEWVRNSDGSRGRSWNPLQGCSLKSDECANCYAQELARRFSGPGLPFHGLINEHGKWNGVIRRAPQRTLLQPLSWKRPTRVFVNSMTDLFHENAEDWWIDDIFAVMSLCPQHTFIVLTKRADRMRQYFAGQQIEERIGCCRFSIIDERVDALSRRTDDLRSIAHDIWPLPNVILGVSCGRRRHLDRIDDLRNTQAALRMVSFEPLLEDLGTIDLRGIHWSVVGGESGTDARPMHPNWARSIRDQCASAGTTFFFKQHGEWVERDSRIHGDIPRNPVVRLGEHGLDTRDLANCTEHTGDETYMQRVGKKAAGRLLDGIDHSEFPA